MFGLTDQVERKTKRKYFPYINIKNTRRKILVEKTIKRYKILTKIFTGVKIKQDRLNVCLQFFYIQKIYFAI